VQADLGRPLPFRGVFDVVFVDAPCSGLGTVRRDPDIRWRRQEPDLAGLAASQLAMLRNAADVVRADGRLVYSTCSSEPDENEDVVAAFLESDVGFRQLDLRKEAFAHDGPLDAVLDSDGALRTRPDRHGLEAFYGTVLRRVK
jgi:16S rRNA (cytosine967-C5)-methyltransferase